jgi:hypothetical protein
MKKLFTFILLAALSLPTFAQFSTSRQRSRYNHNDTERYYGLRLGLNIASMSSDETSFDMDSRTGLSFGGVYGFQLANHTPLWLETGLYYSEKGGKTHWVDNAGKSEKVKMRLSYLQLPVVVKYSFDVVDDLYVQPFFGGYFALGIAGQIKEYGERKSYSSFDEMNRFDGGLRLGCGVEYQMLYAELGFDFGLTNISKSDFEAVRTRNLFINVGVNF